MIRMTKKKAIGQLRDLRKHCCEMTRFGGQSWKNDIAALDVAIECLRNNRNEMIVNDIKRIIERYDEMNLNISCEERKENHIKAYMEIKDYFNTAEDKNTKEVINCAEFRNKEPAQFFLKKIKQVIRRGL